MKRLRLLIPPLAALIGLLVPAGGLAQLPSFMTLDRQDAASRFGLQLGMALPDADESRKQLGLRTELHGQLFFPGGQRGIYGQLPLGHWIVEDIDDELMVPQNLEVGAYQVVDAGTGELVLRLGLSLPTAGDEIGELLTNALSAGERLTDAASGIRPDSTWLRLSLSPLAASGALLFRADLGADVLIKSADDPGSRVVGRLNGALGILFGSAALSIELVNAGRPFTDGDVSDRFVHTLGLGVTTLGPTQLHFGLVLPLDDAARGELWILSFGIKHAS
jgi:hypothetical protein